MTLKAEVKLIRAHKGYNSLGSHVIINFSRLILLVLLKIRVS